MACFIGIDIGTSSAKSIIMSDDGCILATAQRNYDVLRPANGFSEQDADTLWQAVCETLKELSACYPLEIKQVCAIGFSGQMHALLMLDEYMRPLRPAIIWEDQRSRREVLEVFDTVPAKEYCLNTLNELSTGFTLSSLLWVRNNEADKFARIHKILMIKDYVRYKLCASISTESSDACSSGIFDVAARDWAWSLIDRLGLPRDIFPPCHEAADIAGEISEDVAKALGLPTGIIVVHGGGDTPLHLVGTGTISEESPWVANIGTSCMVTCAVNQPTHDEDFHTNTFCLPLKDRWLLMSCGLCGGSALKWLTRNVFPDTDLRTLNEVAGAVSVGSDGLLFLPYLSGSRTPENNPLARGMFIGLTLKHGQAQMMRATMEGVIFSMCDNYNALKRITGREPNYIIASGGGARSSLLVQMQADIFNKPIHTTIEAEQSCIGAAITAGVAVKCYSSYEEGCRRAIHFCDRVVYPIRENVEKYAAYYGIFRELYLRNKELFAKYPDE